MAVLAKDDFTVGSNTNLSAHTNWTAALNDMLIDAATDDVQPNNATYQCCYYDDGVISPSPNQYVSWTFNAAATGYFAGGAVRCSANNFYGAYSDDTNDYLFKYVSGSGYVELDSAAIGVSATDQGKLLAYGVDNTELYYYVNGALICDDNTDGTHDSGAFGVCGLGDSSTTRIDDWYGANAGIRIYDSANFNGGACFELSDGTVCAIFRTVANGLRLYKDVDTTPTLVDTEQDSNTVFGNAGNIYSCNVAVDSNDDVHVVVQPNTDRTRDISYCKITGLPGSGSWGTWEEAIAYTSSSGGGATETAIVCDENDIPHLCGLKRTMPVATQRLKATYANRIGGSWGNEYDFDPGDYNSGGPGLIGKALTGTDMRGYWTESGTLYYKEQASGTWGSENSIGDFDWPAQSAARFTYDGTTHRYYDSPIGDLRENRVDTTFNMRYAGTIRNPSSWLNQQGTRYMMYDDTSSILQYIYNDGGGWTQGDLPLHTFTADPDLQIIANFQIRNMWNDMHYLWPDPIHSWAWYDVLEMPVVDEKVPELLFGGRQVLAPRSRL
jgi:hypothetical protein